MLCVTYNMAGNTFTLTEDEGKYRKPSDHEKFTDGYEKYPGQAQLDDLFRRHDCWHDIYVFCTQEAERSVGKSLLNDSKEKISTDERIAQNGKIRVV